ncbi:MAG: helix-turn-helix transcriptional regulator [Chitinophagales bacterium]|nr:helix-turn-helix transcriptional regulator [Chitinophagales bacterium]
MVEPIDKYVIQKVKEKRLEAGYSQSRLANELEVSNGFIGMVESGKYSQKYSLAQISKIAKILKCSIWELVPEFPL